MVNIVKKGEAQGDRGFVDATSRLNETYSAVAAFQSAATSYSVNINQSCVSSSDSNRDVHCFIATAAYGSYLHKYVVVLKDFRDNVLKQYSLGRKFIDLYYTHSPRVALFAQTHLGIKYKQTKSTEERLNATDPIAIESSTVGLGVMMKFGEMFFLGASADHVTEEGSVKPVTKWIEASVGLGLSQRAENDSWLVELSATRSPEVLNQEDGNVTSYGEKLTTGIYLENEMMMADSMFNSMTLGIVYKKELEKELTNYISADQSTTVTGVNVGIKTFNRSLDATASYSIVQEDFGGERKDTVVGLTLLYKFSGSIFSLAGATGN